MPLLVLPPKEGILAAPPSEIRTSARLAPRVSASPPKPQSGSSQPKKSRPSGMQIIKASDSTPVEAPAAPSPPSDSSSVGGLTQSTSQVNLDDGETKAKKEAEVHVIEDSADEEEAPAKSNPTSKPADSVPTSRISSPMDIDPQPAKASPAAETPAVQDVDDDDPISESVTSSAPQPSESRKGTSSGKSTGRVSGVPA